MSQEGGNTTGVLLAMAAALLMMSPLAWYTLRRR